MQAHAFDYSVVRSRRKSIAIHIRPDGAVQVLCPLYTSAERIDAIVRSKAAWIVKKRLELKRRPPIDPFTADELAALKTQAQKNLLPLIPFYAARIGVSYGRVYIRHQKTRWGSCSAKGNLNFNCLLMLAPPEVQHYVIVHELCHLKQMNHSPKFWQEVESILPDYHTAKQWLKDHGEALIRRLPT